MVQALKKKGTKTPLKLFKQMMGVFQDNRVREAVWSYFVRISFSFPRVVQSLKELFQQLENFKQEYTPYPKMDPVDILSLKLVLFKK